CLSRVRFLPPAVIVLACRHHHHRIVGVVAVHPIVPCLAGGCQMLDLLCNFEPPLLRILPVETKPAAYTVLQTQNQIPPDRVSSKSQIVLRGNKREGVYRDRLTR